MRIMGLATDLAVGFHRLQGEFNLSNTQDGFLATAFLVGLLVASPIFSESCKHYSAFRLIAIGMGTWTVATLGCGLSFNFASLIFCRMLVGVGEASFVALASPFIGKGPAIGKGTGNLRTAESHVNRTAKQHVPCVSCEPYALVGPYCSQPYKGC
jgi:MFS family permease